MARPDNPFFTGINIPDEYFCDRVSETEKLTDYIKNGSNVVLKAPRRIGKSSLIKHLLQQKEIVSRYNTLYVDIFGTVNASGFVSEMQSAFLSASFAKNARRRKEIQTLLQRLMLSASPDPLSGTVVPSIGFSGNALSFTLGEMFSYLEKTGKPNIVVFDEFQQIENYPEKMAAILRSRIQDLNNTHFIFSGSDAHMLESMFNSANKPFYKSSSTMDLDLIPMETYREFCMENYSSYGKSISNDAVDYCYNIFFGGTFDMQEVMKRVFARTPAGGRADKSSVDSAIETILDENESYFRDILNRLVNKKERNTLYAIATEGVARGLTSSEMMKKYALDNASSVQNALKFLTDDKIRLVSCISKACYRLTDTFFELWIDRRSGNLPQKLARKPELFILERSFQYSS